MSTRRRVAYVLFGLALVFTPVIWVSYESERKIAAMALGLSVIAIL